LNIFLIGLPKSGRTTVAKTIAEEGRFKYIDAASWVKATFRERLPNEHLQQYLDEYYSFLSKRLNTNPYFIMDNVYDLMKSQQGEGHPYIIDGLSSPKDFTHLFDYRTDMVVFLNRTDNESEQHRDQDSIAVSCARDYCFWLASADLLPRSRWIEYNFKIPGEDNEFVKPLGSKNSVFIVKSLNRAISHLKETLRVIHN
jgi:adenylate kinase family enzyme